MGKYWKEVALILYPLSAQKYRLLEMVALCGEFPANQLTRLLESPSYAEKLITELKADKLLRTHYRDHLRGYRLTGRAKQLLLSQNPDRFSPYLMGNSETNQVRSELTRRLRLHQKAEVYLTLLHGNIPFLPDQKPDIFRPDREAGSLSLRSLPLFYSSREFKQIGREATKIKNSRSVGVLLAPHCAYALYNTGDHILKWEYRTEVRLNAFLQHYLQDFPYSGHPDVHAILTGKDMNTAYQLLTSTGGYKKSLFVADTSFGHFHYLPNTSEGETLLRLLVRPQLMKQLNQLLLSDLGPRKGDLPIEHDGTDASGNPAILAYDFDMHRLNRFNTGLNIYGKKGLILCFDFQIPCLKRYLTADISFSGIDLIKFRKEVLHEP